MDDTYQKTFNVPIPIRNFDVEMKKWLLINTDADTLQRYVNVQNLHEELVKQADERGDRNLIWHDNGENSFWEIQWKSHEIHMYYMDQIPLEERDFYDKVWIDFREHLETKKRLAAP